MNDEEIERPRTIVMSEIMTPDMTNFSGKIHGGHLMCFFDKVAYACGVQYCSRYVVTLSVDQIFFKKPIYVGDLVTCYATVNYVGKTSMEIGIRAEAENLMTRKKHHTNSCYFTMVALDEAGKPTLIQPLILRTDLERRRFEDAKRRKELRLECYQTQHQE